VQSNLNLIEKQQTQKAAAQKKMKSKTAFFILVVLSLFSNHLEASSLEIDWSARVRSDLRVAVDGEKTSELYRNDSRIGLSLKARLIPYKLRFVGDLDFIWTGFSKDMQFKDLTTRKGVSPYYIESDSAYVEMLGILPYLDIRIGRQIVQWGAADMFNPTNNLNALDLEDPLAFGTTIANQMIRVDFNPGGKSLIFTAVWIPVFQPAQLPGSALLAVGDITSEFPYVDPGTRLEAEKLRNIYLRNKDNFEIMTPNVRSKMPDYSLKNSQFGLKAQWLIGTVDTSISYYYGRDSIPVSTDSFSTQEDTGRKNQGTPVMRVFTDVELQYPKKHVLGFDFAGELPFLDYTGFWFEGAVIFPEETRMNFDITRIVPTAYIINDSVVDENPFFKCTAGMDYSIGEHLMVIGQFIHGFPDEFGTHAINNYWMLVAEAKFLQERLTFRNAVLGEIPHEDEDINMDEDDDGKVESLAKGATNNGRIGSIVYYPELIARPLDGLELAIGAYLSFGHDESKFAMDAAGPSQVFFRAEASF